MAAMDGLLNAQTELVAPGFASEREFFFCELF